MLTKNNIFSLHLCWISFLRTISNVGLKNVTFALKQSHKTRYIPLYIHTCIFFYKPDVSGTQPPEHPEEENTNQLFTDCIYNNK